MAHRRPFTIVIATIQYNNWCTDAQDHLRTEPMHQNERELIKFHIQNNVKCIKMLPLSTN